MIGTIEGTTDLTQYTEHLIFKCLNNSKIKFARMLLDEKKKTKTELKLSQTTMIIAY